MKFQGCDESGWKPGEEEVMNEEIDTGNNQFVGAQNGGVCVLAPSKWMTRDEAIVHAAWLVALSGPDGEERFRAIYEQVCNT